MSADITSRTQLSDRWLTLARLAWVVVAVFYIGAYLVTVPYKLSANPQFLASASRITEQEFLAGVAALGISPAGYVRVLQGLETLLPLVYMALGVFIFWRKSADGMALLTSLFLITFLGPFDVLTHLNSNWAPVASLAAIATSLLIFLWFFLFPDGHFVPRVMRWIFLLFVATQVWRLFQTEQYEQRFALVGLFVFGSILVAQIYRYRHSNMAQRQQIKWVIYGIVVGLVPLLLFFVLFLAFSNASNPVSSTVALNFYGNFLWYFFLMVLPLSITLAILRSRLFDIDVIIRKTLVYTVLTALLALIYFGGVVLVQQLTRSLTASSDLAIAVSTLIIAALFFPLRRRVQSAIDRRFYRRKYDAAKTLAAFGVTARDEVELDKLTAELINVVNETMQPASVSLWLKPTTEKWKKL
jgi:hypothetical protein